MCHRIYLTFTQWDTWVNWTDFKTIADAGFNTVRIPVGYWAYALYDGETYTQGSSVYIDAAIDWARSLGLKVWIDLHGAPGSQNGFDNSGHYEKTPQWMQGDTVAQTLTVLNMITAKYAQAQYQDVVVAIELLNEPTSWDYNFDTLKQFYQNGYDQVRAVSDTPVMIHDGFVAPSSYNNFLGPSTAKNGEFLASNYLFSQILTYIVIVDHHEYQVFSNALVAMTPLEHQQFVCQNAPNYTTGVDKWLVVGEWTAAMTDCALYLNGYTFGARYDGTYPNTTSPESTYIGSCTGKSDITTWSDQFKADMKAYIAAQLGAFESQTNGWVFWNFKTESAHEWDAFKLLEYDVFPTLGAQEAICS